MTITELYTTHETSPVTGILLVKPYSNRINDVNKAPVFFQMYAQKHRVVPQYLICISINIGVVANKVSGRFSYQLHPYSNHEVITISASYGWADEIDIYDAIDYMSHKIKVDQLENSIFLTNKIYLTSRKRTT
ncbi:MAG: hypothetical protein H7196_01505 [candidate division SR1 bacterium]|nr:hypothetical protein [candidate division SR1 bacterium]